MTLTPRSLRRTALLSAAAAGLLAAGPCLAAVKIGRAHV